MFWQRYYLRESTSLTLNDTDRFDLPKNGRLGSILLKITGSEKSGYGQSGGAWRIVDQIDKIEVIVNGSDIVKSFTGEVCQAIAWYDQGVYVPSRWRNYGTNMQAEYFLLNFGRSLFDTILTLDLAKFNSVELKITNSASSSTDFSDLTVSIVLFLLQEADAIPSTGYMRSEEWRNWTTVQNATEYLELPTKHKIRRIVIQATPNVDSNYIESTNMFNLVENIDLSFDSRRTQVINGGLDDVAVDVFLDYGKEVIKGMYPYNTANKGFRTGIGYVTGSSDGAGAQDGAGAGTIPTIESANTANTQKPLTYEADSPMNVLISGYCPGLCVPIRFDRDPDPAGWLDPSERATVNMDVHTRDSSSAASGTIRVMLERLVAY